VWSNKAKCAEQYVSYAVTAVASSGASSSSALALILLAAPALTEPAVLPDGSVQFNPAACPHLGAPVSEP
jgi:hypothetical protein